MDGSAPPACAGCGGAATQHGDVGTCDDCAGLVQAALAGLRPTTWGPTADRFSLPRRAAIVRARWLLRQLALDVNALANEETPDSALTDAIDQMDGLYARKLGHEFGFVVAMRVVDQIQFAAEFVRLGASLEAAVRRVAEQFSEVFPGDAARIDAELFTSAVRDWSDGGAFWKSVHAVLEDAGLRPRFSGTAVGRTLPWENLRREWNRWRAEGGGRATRRSVEELKSRRP